MNYVPERRQIRASDAVEAFGRILEDISHQLALRPLLTSIAQHACALLRADDGAIGLYQPAKEVIRVEAIYRLPQMELNAIPIRLLLVDDHAIVREGLRALLGDVDDFLIVGEAANGDEACKVARQVEPDLVLIDLKMPGMHAPDAIRMLRATLPNLKVLALTSYAEDDQVRDVMRAGALGYVLKDVTKSDFLDALRTVSAGQPWLHPQAQRSLVEQLRVGKPADPLATLTYRERSVLELIAHGKSNRQIATDLSLTEGTVKGYVSIILAKLKLEDRTQAALFAAERGMGRPKREPPGR